jgi:hypothetical protein
METKELYQRGKVPEAPEGPEVPKAPKEPKVTKGLSKKVFN